MRRPPRVPTPGTELLQWVLLGSACTCLRVETRMRVLASTCVRVPACTHVQMQHRLAAGAWSCTCLGTLLCVLVSTPATTCAHLQRMHVPAHPCACTPLSVHACAPALTQHACACGDLRKLVHTRLLMLVCANPGSHVLAHACTCMPAC